ncbi:hypothetical protein D8674_024868 [Pyrus ussuriensis x Pyrus communis]|uniref:Uncharacterized protein n=1 Tax=Pyrus ussuriensis x Pyrus communis TaxID=2448454 RepID=A0A5N5H446_9ROSA|nr:hypothetical protein D8674_024868 [Pyrus ussuriensis x Pyrus communis]
MSPLKSLLLFSILCAILFFASANAARFDIQNNCPYTVWAAAVPGGGRQLDGGQSWAIDVTEYALNQYNNLDFFDISLVDGFNVPMDFSPTSGGCTKGIRLINIVAILELVALQTSLGFLRVGARMLIVTLRMTQPVHLHVLLELTTRLSSALD